MRRGIVGAGALGAALWIVLCGASCGRKAGAEATDGAAPQVQIDAGRLSGSTEDGLPVFRGIPFAAAPEGALRWQPPQPVAAWDGVRSAADFGPACPQPERKGRRFAALGAGTMAQSEDCLRINVWSPALHGHAPVMVWIHGGAHRYGDSSQRFYDGSALAHQGVVLVSFNYRLGLLGYFAHPALTAEAARSGQAFGNYGLLDQLAALAWVKRNIAAFGGDPARITVFGESAGGASLLYLLCLPQAKGLFAQAIVESGGGWQRALSLADKQAEGVKAATAAGLPGAQATMQQLRALPVSALNQALSVAPLLAFGPFVDGRTVTRSPAQAFAAGQQLALPLIIGSNSDESSLLDIAHIAPASVLQRLAPPALQEARSAYAGMAADDQALGRALFADASFTAPARWIATRMHAAGAPAWLYRFAYTLDFRGRSRGAGHGAEIPFVFDTLDRLPTALHLFLHARDRSMAQQMSACWASFARSGRPHCPQMPDWPEYTPDRDALMEFDMPASIQIHFHKAALDFVQARFAPAAGAAP